jgi:peptidoglycan/LPS O-acetylase OafA/YrhL
VDIFFVLSGFLITDLLLAAVTYTSNWYQILHHVSYFATVAQLSAPPPLDHLWSLAIEEQFYVLWPLTLCFCMNRLNGRRACLTATLLAAAGSALVMALHAGARLYARVVLAAARTGLSRTQPSACS